MKAFLIKGDFADKRQGRQPYTIEMAAEDEAAVREKAMSTLGSKHKLKRYEINIASVEELSPEDVTDHVVKHQIGE
ncbi:MAG: 50S ribosomal protein L18Ae [Candidatus Methanomethylophilaceae archaeon]|jgi:large subunit ribosomal protein LX